MRVRDQEREERRKPENRLKRISVENDQEQEGKVQKWLEIADQSFKNDRDDDANPQAA